MLIVTFACLDTCRCEERNNGQNLPAGGRVNLGFMSEAPTGESIISRGGSSSQNCTRVRQLFLKKKVQ